MDTSSPALSPVEAAHYQCCIVLLIIMLLLLVIVTVQIPQALELGVSVLLAPHCSFWTTALLSSFKYSAPLNFVPSDFTARLCCCYLRSLGPP